MDQPFSRRRWSVDSPAGVLLFVYLTFACPGLQCFSLAQNISTIAPVNETLTTVKPDDLVTGTLSSEWEPDNSSPPTTIPLLDGVETLPPTDLIDTTSPDQPRDIDEETVTVAALETEIVAELSATELITTELNDISSTDNSSPLTSIPSFDEVETFPQTVFSDTASPDQPRDTGEETVTVLESEIDTELASAELISELDYISSTYESSPPTTIPSLDGVETFLQTDLFNTASPDQPRDTDEETVTVMETVIDTELASAELISELDYISSTYKSSPPTTIPSLDGVETFLQTDLFNTASPDQPRDTEDETVTVLGTEIDTDLTATKLISELDYTSSTDDNSPPTTIPSLDEVATFLQTDLFDTASPDQPRGTDEETEILTELTATELITELNYITSTEAPELASTTKDGICEEIAIARCKGMSYGMTQFPNILEQQTQAEAEESLEYVSPLSDLGCPAEFLQYMCHLYVPPCESSGIPRTPCKEFCESGVIACFEIAVSQGIPLPPDMESACEHLPLASSVTCFNGLNSTSTSQGGSGDEVVAPDTTCEDIVVSDCKNMPYSETQFPNQIGDQSQADVEETYGYIFTVMREVGCPLEFFQYMCLLFVPPCGSTGVPRIPCAELCLAGVVGCLENARSQGFDIPFNTSACEALPPADSGICFDGTSSPHVPDGLCPDGGDPMPCVARPCGVSPCPAYPNAQCVDNYCNRTHPCLAEYYDAAGYRLDCSGGDGLCPDGGDPTPCFARPCDVSPCPAYPDAQCVDNYCDRTHPCLAVYYDAAGNRLDCSGGGSSEPPEPTQQPEEPPVVRLVGGGENYGRVEVFLDGRWGPVCDYFWDTKDAEVVCRELGFPGASSAPRGSRFLGPELELLMDNVACTGEEPSLLNCSASPREPGWWCYRDTGTDASAICLLPDGTTGVPEYGYVRLVGGNETAGTVEVYTLLNVSDAATVWPQWGTICDDGWDIADAEVICRQLGFPGALDAPGGGLFGEGNGFTLISDVTCSGAEENIIGCGSAVPSCNRGEVAGVVCSPHPDTAPPSGSTIRLAGGDAVSGRVEVFHGGAWNTICDADWDMVDATVACRALGFVGAVSTTEGAHYGEGDGPGIIDHILCHGEESSPLDCEIVLSGECDHSQDAGVVCSRGDGPNSLWYRNDGRCGGDWLAANGEVAECDPTGDFPCCSSSHWCENQASSCDCPTCVDYRIGYGALRLYGGSNDTSGGVIVFMRDSSRPDGARPTWGGVCDEGWDIFDADVVCRHLGYPGAINTLTRGSTTPLASDVACIGIEDTITSCRYSEPPRCPGEGAAGVVCKPPPISGGGSVRLVDGDGHSGRVEVFLDGRWGTVCDIDWDMVDGNVVCRELGYSGALSVQSGAYYGRGSGPINIEYAWCRSDSRSLLSCGGYNPGRCYHSMDAGVVCDLSDGGLRVRLVDGDGHSGRVEVFLDERWGTVCDAAWDMVDGGVVCRELGYVGALSVQGGAYYGRGSGPINIEYAWCRNDSSSLLRCDGYNPGICDHSMDAGVVCDLSDDPCEEVAIDICEFMPYKETQFPNEVGQQSQAEVEETFNPLWTAMGEAGCPLEFFQYMCIRAVPPCESTGVPRVPCKELCLAAVAGCLDIARSQGFDQLPLNESTCDALPAEGTGTCFARTLISFPVEGDLRFVDGGFSNRGRLEVFLDGEWGTVCNRGFDYTPDGNIPCRQLGYGRITAQWLTGQPGRWPQPIHMADLVCDGSEERLVDCEYSRNPDCNHSQDVVMDCD